MKNAKQARREALAQEIRAYRVAVWFGRKPGGPADLTYSTGNPQTATQSAYRDCVAAGPGSWARIQALHTGGETSYYECIGDSAYPRNACY